MQEDNVTVLSRINAAHGKDWQVTRVPGAWQADALHPGCYSHVVVRRRLPDLESRLDALASAGQPAAS